MVNKTLPVPETKIAVGPSALPIIPMEAVLLMIALYLY
jgi:hypothetical protein